jgi:Sec-independent protein secretion pathway component TatC
MGHSPFIVGSALLSHSGRHFATNVAFPLGLGFLLGIGGGDMVCKSAVTLTE